MQLFKPKHQKQPTENSCVCTCVAMALNMPAKEVIREWHDKYWAGQFNIGDILEFYGVKNIKKVPSDTRNPIDESGIWFLAAPSLNSEATLHQLLAFVYKNAEDSMVWEIFDPQMGNFGQKYYLASVDDDLIRDGAVKINGYVVDLCLPLDVDCEGNVINNSEVK